LAAAREYELVLMLDPGRDAPARDALADEARKQIEGGGTLKHENDWGLRKMAYEIARCNEADYRWFRFEAATELLESLDHNLKIADGVLRFRVFKVDPDSPVMVPPAVAAPLPGREGRDGRGEGREGRDRAPQAPPVAPPAAPVGDGDSDSPE
jgi:small subunit ribosomal protein S6